MYKIKGTIDGLAELIGQLRSLDAKVAKKALRKGVSAASKTLLWAARAGVVKKSGLLKKSMGRKVKAYRHTGAVVAIVGPRRGFKTVVTRDGHSVLANPTRYAHLVELGTSHSAAKPFLKPAFDQSKGQMRSQIEAAITEALATLGGP